MLVVHFGGQTPDHAAREEVYGLYATWLPLCLVPQVTLLSVVTLLADVSGLSYLSG